MAEVADAAHFDCVNRASDELGQISTPELIDLRTGKVWAFTPLPDISPIEGMHCAVLLFSAMRAMASGARTDWMAYVSAHNLTRHFAGISS